MPETDGLFQAYMQAYRRFSDANSQYFGNWLPGDEVPDITPEILSELQELRETTNAAFEALAAERNERSLRAQTTSNPTTSAGASDVPPTESISLN